MSTFKYFTKDRYHEACEGQWRPTTCVFLQTTNGKPLTSGKNLMDSS